jgi:hypothetical protein
VRGYACGRGRGLHLLYRPPDPLLHRAGVDLAGGKDVVGTDRRLVRGVATKALRHQQRRAPGDRQGGDGA